MRRAFATRFLIVMAAALSLCSAARADSATSGAAPQRLEGSDGCGAGRSISLIPGHLTEVILPWNARDIHIGDDKLVDVAPEPGDARKILIRALGNTTNDDEKRPRSTLTRTNFLVFGQNNEKLACEVVINNSNIVETGPEVKTESNGVEIYNKKTLAEFSAYNCESRTGCRLTQ